MTKDVEPPKSHTHKEELGLFDSYGSFPVWMLKIISLVTPSFLINKPCPKKKEDTK
jgi:hypothetical protein